MTRLLAMSPPRLELGPYKVLFHTRNSHVILQKMNIRPFGDLKKLSHDGKFLTVCDAKYKTGLRFVNGTAPETLLQPLLQHFIPEPWKQFRLFFLGTTFSSLEKGQEETQWVRCFFWNKRERVWALQFARLDKVFDLIHSKDLGIHKVVTLN
ncbi:hypothetical protein COB87_002760 [Candidatus Wolfebacteria bacterium]|nr:hypothetical protein [Candidatus Wolfebacteria bacterium]